MDEVELTRNVMFVGEYFTLIHTVVLEEQYRLNGESDDDYAVRQATEFMKAYYGWDVAAVAQEIGVIDADAEYEDDWLEDS